ncbi:PstS family phosphate ABC transporter substrate-binding protein [Streptomyces roseolus]|uniref:PstS family phosphate ABC transporter substrate-binding protein n=1 Tax=Streptomyces roseolus TaxID=67358 RepID=UPI001675ED86|nr:substrate-binding domain-containing protein [Streptomyces roseolus]GGR13061.1 phosphate-binding protein [Streptomyces roseolus]
MEWITAENVIAVVTALIGVLVSVAAVWIGRITPGKRLGYRVQLNTLLHKERDTQDGGVMTVRDGEVLGSASDGATLVLLRVENDGAVDITHGDYALDTGGHALRFTFGEGASAVDVLGVVATVPQGWDSLRDDLKHEPKLSRAGNALLVPRVALAPGQYYKLLVQLAGPATDAAIEAHGTIADGRILRNRSTTPDDESGRFGPVARTVTVVLTACVVALAAIIVREQTPPPIGCARGSLTVTGSTAFAPVAREVAEAYEKDCAGATVTVDADGSTAGVRDLAAAGAATGGKGSPAVIALSDGHGPAGHPRLREHMVAVSLFTVVAHDAVPVESLTLEQIRALYRGDVARWNRLEGPGLPADLPDLPVLLVSRDAGSGTREVFQRRVLGRNEPANSSRDCATVDDKEAKVVRCELDSTDQVLATVARLPGALGYAELGAGSAAQGLHGIALDGRGPVLDELGSSPYPYREIEYAYTWGDPPTDSLTASFLAYLTRGRGQDIVRARGHLPCATPKGLRVCGEE